MAEPVADIDTRDILARVLAGQREPVVAPWLTALLNEAQTTQEPLHGAKFPRGLFAPITGAAELGAELSGIPSIMRGIGHLRDPEGNNWRKAQGVGEITLGAIPGLSVTRAASPLVSALIGTAPRAAGTVAAAALPAAVVSAQDSQKAADAVLSQIKPPDYMTKELGDLQSQKAAKQQEFNALNERHKRSGPETQRQALDPLRKDLSDLNDKVAGAEGRIRDYLAGETERKRKELPFRERYPGAAETIGGTAAALSAFLPFASTLKNRAGEAMEGWLMGRAAKKADAMFNADKLPEFVEAQAALSRRAQNLDNKTSGALYPIFGVQGPKLATQVGLGTLINFEGGSIPEQVDALAFPPGHPTRENARNELTKSEYYTSRLLPAALWGLGMTGIGTEAGHLLTPGARVPEKVRSVVDRGSAKSIEQLNQIAQYRQALEDAKGAGQRNGAAQRLEAAASESAPLARLETSGQPALSAPGVIVEPAALQLEAARQGLAPATAPSRKMIEALSVPSPANTNKLPNLPKNHKWDDRLSGSKVRGPDGRTVKMPDDVEK